MTYQEFKALNDRNRKLAKKNTDIHKARLMHFTYDFEKCALQFALAGSCVQIYTGDLLMNVVNSKIYLERTDLCKSYFVHIDRINSMI